MSLPYVFHAVSDWAGDEWTGQPAARRFSGVLAGFIAAAIGIWIVLLLNYVPSFKYGAHHFGTLRLELSAQEPVAPFVENVLGELRAEKEISVDTASLNSLETLPSPADSNAVALNSARSAPRPSSFSSQELISSALSAREAPLLSGRTQSEGPYFDSRLNAALSAQQARRAQGGERAFSGVEEYSNEFGEHVIRSGNLCATNNSTMAKLLEIDTMYFVSTCGTQRDEIEFHYEAAWRFADDEAP